MTKTKPTKADRRAREKLKALGHGVFVLYRDGKPTQIELREVPALRRQIGSELMVGFVMAFNAAERLDAITHLVTLNDAAHAGRLAHNRNHRFLVAQTFGTLYEAMQALLLLHQSGIAKRLGRYPPWIEFDAMRRRWARNHLLKDMRHQFAHHLANEEITAGLKRIAPGERTVLFKSEEVGGVQHSEYPIVLQALLAGARLQAEEFNPFVPAAIEDALKFGRLTQQCFIAVLRLEGVKFADDPAASPAEATGTPTPNKGAR